MKDSKKARAHTHKCDNECNEATIRIKSVAFIEQVVLNRALQLFSLLLTNLGKNCANSSSRKSMREDSLL